MAKRIQKSSGGGISIHAPAWGATNWRKSKAGYPTHFNSRPRVGGDLPVACPP